MTAPSILRSNPRYSSSTTGGAKPDVADASSSSAADATPAHVLGGHSVAEKSAGVTTKTPLRSLADLAKRAADLSAEATGTSKNERANVVSHRSKGQRDDDAKVMEEKMSTLLISEEGVPYLKENAPDASGPPVVDANSVIAVGVMGEDGQQVRFCEIEDDDNTGEVGGDTPSSRGRLEERMDAGFEKDFEFDDDDEKDDTNTDSDSDEEFDAKVLEELGLSELMRDSEGTDEDAGDYEPPSDAEELRPFRVLWELLTQRWATPSTVERVLGYNGKGNPQGEESPSASSQSPSVGEQPDADTCRNAVDIGASRVASIMSMLKMSIPRSLSELKKMHNIQSQHGFEGLDQRQVELRLADLVRTFDASAPAANLNMKMWRGLTTILIAIAFPSLGSDSADDALLPPSIRPLKLSAEEYRYLTRSAIVSLSSTA